ncbi:unnamed protein product [Cylicostephanus goldi]|uniref:Uncharacterized protein n=1 Tax=Cylicostephanus goldi TaxID=71465 RepID=A0A3P6QQP2_CYLGO|nr:unnamed protein product [Cylicostephanus goldi]
MHLYNSKKNLLLFIQKASISEPDLQQCILHTPVQHLAIQTVGTFGLELTVAVNLTLAAVRLVTLLFGPKQANRVAGVGILISVIWSVSMCVFHQLGLVTKIWLDENGKYVDRLLPPFNIIRIPLLITELFATFLLYMVTIILLKTKSGSDAANMVKSEKRFLIQSLLTFLSELIHLYGTFWIGHRYLHLGDAQFNANLNFISRPISVGLTPVTICEVFLL